MTCPKCSNQGRYYKHEAGITHIIPCPCKQSMKRKAIKEQEYKNFCKRLDEAYEREFGTTTDEERGTEHRKEVLS